MPFTMKKSLAGTDKEYAEVSGAEGFRARIIEDEDKVRIHVLKDAAAVNSREREKYWAVDVPVGAMQELGEVFFTGSEKKDGLVEKAEKRIGALQNELNALEVTVEDVKQMEEELRTQRAVLAEALEIA